MALFDPTWDPGRLGRGLAAGLAAGVAFGILLDVGGMMPDVARLAGGEGRAVGWAVHLFISAIFGMLFATVVAPGTVRETIPLGVVYGLGLWAIAGMLAMRLALAMPFAMDEPALLSLVGHLLYGGVLGAVYGAWMVPEREAPPAAPRLP